MALDRRWTRRVTIVPLTLAAAALVVVFGPVVVAAAALIDLATGRPDWRRLRLAALVMGAVMIETAAIATAFGLWIATGFGRIGTRRWRWRINRPLMGWYTNTLLRWIVWVLGTQIEWGDDADLDSGPVVVIARHTSFFDALIPAAVLSARNRLLAHHVVSKGLRYAPAIDIVGHRFPNRFIARTPGEGSSELGGISAVGASLDAGSGAIIFPEGTFRNPARFERSVRRLRRRQPDLASRAERLDHVLPPRPSGTYALLQGASSADVVICANTGFERFGSLRDIVARPSLNQPVRIATWRIERQQIPDDPEEFARWLFDQFVAIDAWVGAQQSEWDAGL